MDQGIVAYCPVSYGLMDSAGIDDSTMTDYWIVYAPLRAQVYYNRYSAMLSKCSITKRDLSSHFIDAFNRLTRTKVGGKKISMDQMMDNSMLMGVFACLQDEVVGAIGLYDLWCALDFYRSLLRECGCRVVTSSDMYQRDCDEDEGEESKIRGTRKNIGWYTSKTLGWTTSKICPGTHHLKIPDRIVSVKGDIMAGAVEWGQHTRFRKNPTDYPIGKVGLWPKYYPEDATCFADAERFLDLS